MQKVLQRTVFAERQAARRLAKRKEQNERIWRKSNRDQTRYSRKESTSLLKNARLARREDWELGPLKPRRDVGDSKDTYGTVSTQQLRGPVLEEEARKKAREAIGGRFMNIVKGDRVVLLSGKDKGKIGKISAVDTERCEFTVAGLNMIDVNVPRYMIGPEEADQRPIRSIEKPVPFDKVRLVFPLPDKETGVTRDVIVKELVHARLWFEKGKASWKRVIPGLNVTIPWPRVEPQEFKDHPGDTLRFEVETRTFMPTLLSPPMPGSVIDELRNRFSKFRTRHDAWYVEKKEAEEAEEQAKKRMAKEMRTPLKEIHAKERAANRAKGNKVMSADLKEKIGRLIAQKRQLMMDAAGVEKVAA